MCGIAGIAGYGFRNSEALIEKFCSAFKHRGPDGAGFFVEKGIAMGMRRLSVIDLSHGWQPFFSRGKHVVAFQNGEIYNFRLLRKELETMKYRFISSSDTEILAHGYDAWGIEGLLQKIDGMFAIAILDIDSRQLHLARDRFGEKPLYYVAQPGFFAYSSDLQALMALPGISTDIDPAALEHYLALHFVPGERTIFSAAKKLLPGHGISVSIDEPSRFNIFRYFRQELCAPKRISDDDLAKLVERAVHSRLVADVPVGVFLSGGLDSSIVAAIAAKASAGIATFSMGFDSPEYDESIYARQVAELIGSDHHHFSFDCGRFKELLPVVADSLDEPIGDQACLPLYWLCAEARKHVTVALAGEGADEIFAGYGYYRDFSPEPGLRAYFRALLRGRPIPMNSPRLIHNDIPATPSGFPLLTDVAGRIALHEEALDRDPDAWETALMSWLGTSKDALQRATAADLATWLPDNLLIKFDRMAMAHSLEGRAPFLMPELVNAALHLPGMHRMAKGTSKIALRRIAERWIPRDIIHRKKQGFVLPMKNWLLDWFRTHGGVRAYFAERHIPCLNMANLVAMIEEDIRAGLNRERFLFAMVMLCEWYRQGISRIMTTRKQYMSRIEL